MFVFFFFFVCLDGRRRTTPTVTFTREGNVCRQGSDADSSIELLLKPLLILAGLIVVTSDDGLSLAVRSRGAKTVRSASQKGIEGSRRRASEDLQEPEVGDVRPWLRNLGKKRIMRRFGFSGARKNGYRMFFGEWLACWRGLSK